MPADRATLRSSQPSQASRAPLGDHAQHPRFGVGSGLSSSVKPDPWGLTVAGRINPAGFARQTRILLPSGAQRGHSAAPGRSCASWVPSGLAVMMWKSSMAGSNRPKTIRPFGPGTFAPADGAAAAVATAVSKTASSSLGMRRIRSSSSPPTRGASLHVVGRLLLATSVGRSARRLAAVPAVAWLWLATMHAPGACGTIGSCVPPC